MSDTIKILESTQQYTLSQLKEIITAFEDSSGVELILTVTKKEHFDYLSSLGNTRNLRIVNRSSKVRGRLNDGYLPDSTFSDVLQSVYRNESIFLLLDRILPEKVKQGLRIDGNFHYSALISKLAWDTYSDMKQYKPDYLLFASTPHALAPWIKALVAELMGVNVLIIRRGFVRNFKRLIIGLRREAVSIRLYEEQHLDHQQYIAAIQEYERKIGGAYSEAMPDYERKRLERNKGKIFSYKYILSKYWFKPKWFTNAVKSWKTLSHLSQSVKNFVPKKYVVLFLHYQPERTTLPEGYGFAQQLNAVMALRSVLPVEIEVLVKEHPSTYTNQCHFLWRSPQYYKLIDKIHGVSWVNIETDTFELIDTALCTASITGTVGVESLMRGTPTVYFGLPIEKDIFGQHVYESGLALKEFMNKVVREELPEDKIKRSIRETIYNDSLYSFFVNSSDSGKSEKLWVLKRLLSNPEILRRGLNQWQQVARNT